MAKKQAVWTVMVYLAGDNNLSTECIFALTEMEKATLGKELNVIAQFDPSDPFLPTHRYEISRNGNRKNLHFDIIDRAAHDHETDEVKFSKESNNARVLGAVRRVSKGCTNTAFAEASLIDPEESDEVITDDTDTGSPIPLYNFISFCLEKYPADHYMVVLSGHAGGTERDYLLRDESAAGSLTFNELKQVFKRVRKDRKGVLIDIVGMDNCLMSMAEICYELRGLAEVVVGCESFSPASGWPYRQILERLRKDFADSKFPKGQAAAEAAKSIVEEYVNYYSHYWIAGLSVTQSALNLSKVEKLQRQVDKLGCAMEKELVAQRGNNADGQKSTKDRFQDALLLAHWEAQSYNGEQFVDLFDFCDCLENRVSSKTIATRCREVKEFLRTEFVLKSCYCGADYQYSYGVSMYFPWSQVAPAYWNLDFVKDTRRGWGSFLRTYTLLTRREPRGVEAETKLGAALSETIDARLTSVRMATEHMATDGMATERMAIERMAIERMASGVTKNRIHSMRNPPNVFFPDECIRDRRNTLATQETLRIR